MKVTSGLILGLAAIFVFTLASCGGEEESAAPPKAYTKGSGETMKSEGTAETEEEKKKRADAADALAKENAAFKDVKKAILGLSSAEDAFDIEEYLSEIGKHGAAAVKWIDQVEKFLTHEDASVRACAVKAVAEIGGEKSKASVQKALEDDSERVKTAAATAWKDVAGNDMTPLYGLLEDFDSGVQRAAVTSLTASFNPAAHDKVVSVITDLDAPAAKVALAWMVKNKDKVSNIEDRLVAMFEHMDPNARLDSVKALGALIAKKKKVVTNLVKLLGDDPDLRVRKEAHVLLSAWAGAGAPAYDPDAKKDVRKTAYEAWKTWLAANESKFN